MFCFKMDMIRIVFTILLSLINYVSSMTIPSDMENRFTYEGRYWQDEIVYQIYPRSFSDSDGDGIGDLPGIKAKVRYLKDLGVGIIWISPIYESPMKDFGYDISNYTNIDPIFGTLQDFDELVKVYHNEDMKVVMDFVPNHTSDQHEWFLKSVERDPTYEDFYIWKNPVSYHRSGRPVPPNNWLSSFRYSAWAWNEKRQQFYYHKYLKEQPDLNYRNPKVIEAMKQVLRFWLDRGVDGFRLDAVTGLIEAEFVVHNDESAAQNSKVTDPQQYQYLNHSLTTNLPETLDIIRGWKKVLFGYGRKLLMGEVSDDDVNLVMKYYGSTDNHITDFPFNFYLVNNLHSRNDVTGTNLKSIIDLWLDNMPEGRWPNWVLGSHDSIRVGSRLGEDLIDSLNMLSLLLPGTSVTYNGEEIGMMNTEISYDETVDPLGCNFGPERYSDFSRDPERTPMQWNNSPFAGFTNGNKTWLPVNQNYKVLNVEAQQSAPQSSYKLYASLARLRKLPVFRRGKITFLSITNTDTLAFIRSMKKSPTYIIVINTSQKMNSVNLLEETNFELPEEAKVFLRSSHDLRIETDPEKVLSLSSISLKPGEGMVLVA